MNMQNYAETTGRKWGAFIVALAPLVMLLGFVLHPWLGNPGDAEFHAELADAVSSKTTVWAISHLTVAAGSGLLLLAFLAVRSYLRQTSDDGWSAVAVPFIVLGSVFSAMLPAMEFAPVVAADIGADVEAVQGALETWFVPVLLTSGIFFLLGAIGFAIGLIRSSALSPGLARLVAAGIVVMAATHLIPLSVTLQYVGPAVGVAAMWPLAYAMWKEPAAQLSSRMRAEPSRGIS